LFRVFKRSPLFRIARGTPLALACFLMPSLFGVVCLASGEVEQPPGLGLAEVERTRLVQLVADDAEAGRLYTKIKATADAALAEQGSPIETIRTASTLESDPDKVKSRASLRDMKSLSALGYAYAVSSRQAYADTAKRIILSWARANQPTGLPIDETKLEPLEVAYALTQSRFSESERDCVGKWLRNLAAREIQTGQKKAATTMNNWQSHRLKNVGLIGFLLSDPALIDYATRGYKRQIEANLEPDGSSFDFHERDALHYHCYDLEPLLTLAIVARRNGVKLYEYEAPNGASLPKAVAFLAPYCRGEKEHLEWVHSRVVFDRKRADAGESKFIPGTAFDPRDGRKTFELASYFTDEYRPMVVKLSARVASKYPTWQLVINAVTH